MYYFTLYIYISNPVTFFKKNKNCSTFQCNSNFIFTIVLMWPYENNTMKCPFVKSPDNKQCMWTKKTQGPTCLVLSFLDWKFASAHLIKWSLCLQECKYSVGSYNFPISVSSTSCKKLWDPPLIPSPTDVVAIVTHLSSTNLS